MTITHYPEPVLAILVGLLLLRLLAFARMALYPARAARQ